MKLHRCGTMWLKIDRHPCWRVQKALDETGIDYEVATHPHGRAKRDEIESLSGQRTLPVIELEDGSTYRDESKQMAERIRSGELVTGSSAAS